MDHNGLYADLDSFSSITSSFNDTCATLPSLNNFKYQQTNLSTNIYQQPVLHDLQPQQQHQQNQSSQKPSSSLPQTQININNCNNNIFFPHDDGIFDANTSTQCAASSTVNPSNNQKNNFIGYVRKESGPSGSGGDNITYNINNINTNIVNNINNPTNLVNGADIFGGNQYHQINKNGETIINFTNNNLNSVGGTSMPADTVSATSQNYYGYQTNTNSNGQTVFESSVQSQSSSTYLDPTLNTAQKSANMGTTGYHGHHQTLANGSYHTGNTNQISSDHVLDPFSEYPDSLNAAKIINSFESKNPLKYQTMPRQSSGGGGGGAGGGGAYYKNPVDYPQLQYPPVSHLPPQSLHNYPGIYQPNNKIPPAHNYEAYQRIPRNYAPPTAQHFAPPIDDHNNGRIQYSRSAYHHPQMPPNSFGNFYGNGYGSMPTYPAYPQGPPYSVNPCSKSSTNYNKTGAIAMSPVEHNNFHAVAFPPAPKKEFYSENLYFQPPHPYYEDPNVNALNSCAKKPSSRAKVSADIYNPNGAAIYPPLDHHAIPSHHPSRNVAAYPNPMGYPNQCDPYLNYGCHPYKNGEHPKMSKISPPQMNSKQFKSYGHFEPIPPPPHLTYGNHSHPQYHTMQAKPPEKIKISIDLEDQINSSKIPKYHQPHPYYQYHPQMQPRHRHHHLHHHHQLDNDSKANNLRDFLSSWNEIDDDEESRPLMNGLVGVGNGGGGGGGIADLSEHVERTIMREYNPMFVQKASADLIPNPEISSPVVDKAAELDGTEKLYVLESFDVPLCDLNKYRHLSVINKLPENVVVNDKELLYASEGEKLYKSEFELEFEACEEQKKIDESEIVKVVEKVQPEVKTEAVPELQEVKKVEPEDRKKKAPIKAPVKVKAPKEKLPRILKLKKEKILKTSKVRITKRVKKYSLNQRTSSVKTLQSICVDFVNTSSFRNYAREQIKISEKFSKMKILKDFKKKFNFDGIKRQNSGINQKLNHSVGINSLREMCGKLLTDKSKLLELDNDDELLEEDFQYSDDVFEDEIPSLKNLCEKTLTEMDISVMQNEYLYTPGTLKEICESFVYSNNQYFHIEEVSSVPKLQELCKGVLSETNIFINMDDEIFENSMVDESAPIYIMEENSGNVGELFESENLDSFERNEIMRKIQSIEDDDEIIRAIGALHRGDDDVESIINNNDTNVSNKNISNEFSTEEMKVVEEESSVVSYMEDDLSHPVQYEEIISGGRGGPTKTVEILRHKHLNRTDVRRAMKITNTILKKSLTFQRIHRFRNAKRREHFESLRQRARIAQTEDCDRNSAPFSDNESQINAKEPAKAHSHQNNYDDNSPLVDNIACQAETCNFPKLPSVLPSINEYKIDRKSSNRSGVKDMCAMKRRKMTFDESLLSIDKIYGEDEGPRRHSEGRRNDNERRHSTTNVFDERKNYGDRRNDSVDIRNEEKSNDHLSSERRNEELRSSSDRHSQNSERRNSHDHHNVDRRSNERHSSERRNSNDRHQNYRRTSSSSSSHSNSSRNHRESHSRNHDDHHRTSSRHHKPSSRRRSRELDNEKSRNSYHHNSSRQNYYRRDQMHHSETKRLVIPSYKVYDKNLDIKLKIMPVVRIEREEMVDEMVKKYN